MRSWFLNHELCGSYPRRILDRSVVFSQRDVKLSRSRLRGDHPAISPKPVCGPRQRSAEGIPDYSQITDNTQRRCAVHTKSGKEINLNGLVGSVPSSIPQTSC